MNVSKVYIEKEKLDNLCKESLRIVEVNGGVNENARRRIDDLKKTFGMDVSIVITPDSARINLGESIQIKSSLKTQVGISSLLMLPITLSSQASGVSEVYFKND